MRASSWLLPAVCLWTAGAVVDAQESTGPTVEYIAHAAVIIESSSGTRVLIDPYTGDMWMGYDFPNGIEVDGVRFAHLGDNRSPTAEHIRGIGGADVWFVTPFTPAAEVRAIALLRQAVARAPSVINFHLALAEALADSDQPAQAREVLEHGLLAAPNSDIERTLRVHGLLGRLLADAGLNERAATHYRFVLGQKRTYAADVLAESRAFMEGR